MVISQQRVFLFIFYIFYNPYFLVMGRVKESEVTGSYHSVITQADYPPPVFFFIVTNSVSLQAVSELAS